MRPLCTTCHGTGKRFFGLLTCGHCEGDGEEPLETIRPPYPTAPKKGIQEAFEERSIKGLEDLEKKKKPWL